MTQKLLKKKKSLKNIRDLEDILNNAQRHAQKEKMIWLIMGFNLLFFWKTLFYNYVCDDFVVSHKSAISPPGNIFVAIWRELTGQGYYNPLRSHFITILFHTVVCFLIYNIFGIWTALLFSVLPANTECSVWLSGKPYLLFSILLLSVVSISKTLGLNWQMYLILAIPSLILFIIILNVKLEDNKPFSTREGKAIHWRKIILFVKSYGYYFRLCLVPRQLGFYHKIGTGVGLTERYTKEAYEIDKDFWWGVVILWIVITNIIFTQGQPFIYGLIWFSVFILPFCNMVSFAQGTALRYAYIANIGLIYSLTCIVTRPEALVFILGTYMTRTWFYMPAYRSEFWFAEYQIQEQPRFFRGWLMRGIKKFKAEDYSGALLDFVEATELCPHDCKSNFNVAQMYLAIGDIEHAEEYLRIAKENIFQNSEKDNMIAWIVQAEAKIEEGKKYGRFKLEKLYVMK